MVGESTGRILSDFTVEVRDKYLRRIGVVPSRDLVLEWSGVFNNVGTWKLTLPADHPSVASLQGVAGTGQGLNDFGGGIIVSVLGRTLFSGPMTTPSFEATSESMNAVVVFEGVTDEALLADRLCYPDPEHAATSQLLSHDQRTGPAETVMHQYVSANLGPTAQDGRRLERLRMGEDFGRGAAVTKRARFDVLGAMLNEIARPSDLGFRLVQVGTYLRFDTYQTRNRTKEIRFSIKDSSLTSQRGTVSAPGATNVIVAGQGELTDRQFIERSVPSTEWGRRIEVFVDQRQTNDLGELTQAGDEVLGEQGFTAYNLQAVPADDDTRRFGVDYNLGDIVSVEVNQKPFPQVVTLTVTGVVLKIDADGVRLGFQLGSPTAFNDEISNTVSDLSSRVSGLERNVEPSRTATYQYGEGNAILGTDAQYGYARKIRRGTFVTITNSAGRITLPDNGFKNGLTYLNVTPGDIANGLAAIVPVLSVSSASSVVMQAYTAAGAAVASRTIRVNYEMEGW